MSERDDDIETTIEAADGVDLSAKLFNVDEIVAADSASLGSTRTADVQNGVTSPSDPTQGEFDETVNDAWHGGDLHARRNRGAGQPGAGSWQFFKHLRPDR